MDTFSIAINKSAEEPIYRQGMRRIQEQIAQGTLQPGDRLPASRDLAEALGISRISVVNAYAQLQESGALSAHPGRGTFVASASAPTADPRLLPSIAANPVIQSMQRLAQQPGIIAFSGAAPAAQFLPVQAIRQSINAVLDRDGAAAVAYQEPEGYPPLAHAVTAYIASPGTSNPADP